MLYTLQYTLQSTGQQNTLIPLFPAFLLQPLGPYFMSVPGSSSGRSWARAARAKKSPMLSPSSCPGLTSEKLGGIMAFGEHL